MNNNLEKVELDVIELHLNTLKHEFPNEVKDKTYKEIAELIQSNFSVVCKEKYIRLLHEPTIEEDISDTEIFYSSIFGYSVDNHTNE
jgi:hypothetical protein